MRINNDIPEKESTMPKGTHINIYLTTLFVLILDIMTTIY